MLSNMRSVVRAPRVRFAPSLVQPRRWAHQSYGNEQSGHPQGRDEKNPKEHLEHPGPESPVTQGKGQSQSSPQSQQSSSPSSGGKPAIHNPESAAESSDPEVKKHNEEMRQRADRSANQLSEEDNKVDKKFWKGKTPLDLSIVYTDHLGDVGDMSKDKSSDS